MFLIWHARKIFTLFYGKLDEIIPCRMGNSQNFNPVLWEISEKNPVCLTHGASKYIRVEPPGYILKNP